MMWPAPKDGKVKSNKLLGPSVLMCHQASFDQYINYLSSLFLKVAVGREKHCRELYCIISALSFVIGTD